ncbi:hypothetical protein J4221_05890 [Candidatus Pacearchaeota archaeon]|nr:hypothetical protein [Candidatus Pacearchaeota archaeon]
MDINFLPNSKRSARAPNLLFNNNLPNSKRSQITVFIILASAIVLVIGIGYYMFSNQKSTNMQTNTNAVYSFVQLCLDETLRDGINFIALSGGYYNVPILSTNYFIYTVPYYFVNKESHVPSLFIIEQEIDNYIEDNLIFCLQDFSNFKDKIVESGEIISKTIIDDNLIMVSVDYPLKVTSGEDIIEFSNFSSSTEINLKKAYDIAYRVIEQQRLYPDEIPLGFTAFLAYQEGFEFETITVGEDVIYSIIFESNSIKPLIYNFAINYNETKGNETNL